MELANKLWTKRIGLAGLGLCAALALAVGRAGDVSAPDEEEIKGDFNKPLGQDDNQSGSSSRSVMTTVDGGDSYTVTNNNGKVTVQKNGEKLSKSQFRQKNGKIEILDGDGNVVKTLAGFPNVNVGSLRHLAMVAPRTPAPPAAPGAPRAPGQARVIVKGAPRVMLGVTMTDADPEVLEKLGVDDGGVVLNSVAEGLPAAQAGLQAKDIVVEADGKPVDGEEALRGILKTKSPGDELALKIFRKGESKTFNVKLAAFDASKLQPTITVDRLTDDSRDSQELVEILKGVEAQVKVQVEALQAQLNATDWNKVRDQVSAGLAEAMKQLEEARVQASEAGEMGAKWWQEHGQNFNIPKGWVQFTQPTPAPAAQQQGVPHHDVGDKLDRLSEQLEKMNKRLDAMEKQIEKK
ncbi:MAG: S1C family serine protease [Phycisphaerales bacterium]